MSMKISYNENDFNKFVIHQRSTQEKRAKRIQNRKKRLDKV